MINKEDMTKWKLTKNASLIKQTVLDLSEILLTEKTPLPIFLDFRGWISEKTFSETSDIKPNWPNLIQWHYF